ncbi:hypothetical protein [Vibrio maerlii]|uniref:hypothetical protein n=1 Tax=Vibrio maerlii TaxID=2231648 RepID=UPI000E3CEDC2|nr:hypothetical protein [Vibrio maerlii]
MSAIEPELINALKEAVLALSVQISKGQSKSWLDFVPIWIASAAPLLAVFLSFYYFKKQHVQNAKNRIAEKDVARLYEAADSFFVYADALDLFFSMTTVKFEYLSENKGVPESIDSKAVNAAEAVYSKFEYIHKSEFLLRSLDKEKLAQEVVAYRKATIKLRKQVVDIAKWKSGQDYPSNLNDQQLTEIKKKRKEFICSRNKLLDKIAACKKDLFCEG